MTKASQDKNTHPTPHPPSFASAPSLNMSARSLWHRPGRRSPLATLHRQLPRPLPGAVQRRVAKSLGWNERWTLSAIERWSSRRFVPCAAAIAGRNDVGGGRNDGGVRERSERTRPQDRDGAPWLSTPPPPRVPVVESHVNSYVREIVGHALWWRRSSVRRSSVFKQPEGGLR